MYCQNCGQQIDDKAIVCPHCGVATGKSVQSADSKTNAVAIVGFIFSFFISLIGLICSIVGYANAPKHGGNGRGLSVAGIVISTISIVIVIIAIIVSAVNSSRGYSFHYYY